MPKRPANSKTTKERALATAFVAMRFADDPWRDKRYAVIREVLEEAGFRPVRADEVATSGGVVDEVCRYLRESDLVVIDSTGNSHSVSYEIGYCHGVGRASGNIVLLREGTGDDIPFNIRHFRHRCYRDLRHLRRLLREWFQLTRPIPSNNCGYAFVLDGKVPGVVHGETVASAVIRVLRDMRFSGRVEYYAADRVLSGFDHYVVGLGLRHRSNKQVKWEEWKEFKRLLGEHLLKVENPMRIEDRMTEMGTMLSIRGLPSRGVAEFEDGKPARVINPSAAESDSWFISQIRDALGESVAEKPAPDPSYELVVHNLTPDVVSFTRR